MGQSRIRELYVAETPFAQDVWEELNQRKLVNSSAGLSRIN